MFLGCFVAVYGFVERFVTDKNKNKNSFRYQIKIKHEQK